MKRALFFNPGFALALAFAGSICSAAELFIAPTGNDSNPGTKSKPFATLERARAEVRALRQKASAPGSITVWLAAGDYLRTNTFELGSGDSGSPSQPVAWRAQEGARARLLGGRRLDGARPLMDPALVQRLAEPARGRVLAMDLRALGITDFGEMQSRGFSRPISSAHCEFFYDGKPLTLARWPNEGSWEKIAGFPEENAENDGHGGKIGRLDNGFFYEGGRPRTWRDIGDVWVHGYWSWDWANSYEKIANIDLDKRLVKTAPPRAFTASGRARDFSF